MTKPVDVADVSEDGSAARLVAECAAGVLTVAQAVRLAMAAGRIQGHYLSGRQLAREAGLIREHNISRRHGAGGGDELNQGNET